MTNFPLVTVIIPSFNHAGYIEQAIASVEAQTYPNWELIIVDDGSSDGTATILQKYLGQQRITIICNEVNRGQSAVINQALAKSSGEFVCFLPSDDWYLPDKLSLQVEKFQELDSTFGVVYGRGRRYFEDTGAVIDVGAPVYSGWVLRKLIDRNFIYPITPMFRRECFERYPFDERYKAEGEAIYLKLALSYQFHYVADVVGVMRDHSRNTGKDVDLMYRDNLNYWLDFFGRADLPPDIRKLKNWRISRLLRLKGLEYINLRSRPKDGQAVLLKAVRMWPRNALDPQIISGLALSCLPVSVANSIYRAQKLVKNKVKKRIV